jgi:hypothetical protein
LHRRLFQFSWKRSLLIGLLCGVALVSKPSTGPFTAVILATAFVGSVLLYVLDVLARDRAAVRTGFRAIARVTALIGLGAAIVAGPVYAIIWRDVYAYILLALVELHDVNAAPGDFLFQLLFYSTGPAGGTVLGQALWVLLLFWVAAFTCAIYKGDLLPRLICYLAVILVAYAIPTYTDTKTLWLGGAFYGTLIALTCAIVGELWRIAAKSNRLTGLRIGAAGLIGVAGIALLVRANALHHPVVFVLWASPEVQTDTTKAAAQVWSVLKDHVVSREKELATPKTYNVMVLSPEPVTDDTLSLLAVTQDVPLRAYGAYYAKTIDELVLQIKNFDYAVVTNSIQQPLPGPRLSDVFVKVMDDRPDFKLITSYSRLVGGTVKVYEHRL